MKFAIYDRKGSFSERWIKLCRARQIPYITVDLFDDMLLDKLCQREVKALLAHPPVGDRAGTLAASAVIKSINASRRWLVFPTSPDYWHYDNKIAQKYIFDAVGIRAPETRVFFSRNDALRWAKHTTFPWVFKLKAGVGSANVALVGNRKQAIGRINRMFGRGYAPYAGAIKNIGNKVRKHRQNHDWMATVKRAPKTLQRHWKRTRELDRERGYAYFQEFIDGNNHDTCVIVIGERAFAFRRHVMPGDFRASGSEVYDFNPSNIDIACIKQAFDAAARLDTMCIAFDLIKDQKTSEPLIVEMSYEFDVSAGPMFHGYWGRDLSWHESGMWPQDAILEDVLQMLERQENMNK